MHPDSTIIDTHRRGPLVFVKLLIRKRAVLISLHHKMFDHISKIVVLEPLSLTKKQSSELTELATSTRMLLRRRHHINLANRNTTVAEHLSDFRMLIEQPCPPLDPQRINTEQFNCCFKYALIEDCECSWNSCRESTTAATAAISRSASSRLRFAAANTTSRTAMPASANSSIRATNI